jgi:hypothetical protein
VQADAYRSNAYRTTLKAVLDRWLAHLAEWVLPLFWQMQAAGLPCGPTFSSYADVKVSSPTATPRDTHTRKGQAYFTTSRSHPSSGAPGLRLGNTVAG